MCELRNPKQYLISIRMFQTLLSRPSTDFSVILFANCALGMLGHAPRQVHMRESRLA